MTARTAQAMGVAPEHLVATRALTFTYASGRRGVVDLNLEVAAGERLVVLGANGSGKSTLIHLLAGLLEPTQGSASVLGAEASRLDRTRRRRMGVALDRAAHWEALTGSENARLLARAAGLSTGDAAAAAEKHLRLFQLESDVPVKDYSLGMKRKLLLAQVLTPAPDLLLLDEPTLGLDPPAVGALADAIGERATFGAATITATNDVRAAAALGSRVVFLLEGRKAADEAMDVLLARLQTLTRLEVTLAGGAPVALRMCETPGGPADLALREESGLLVGESHRGAEPLPGLLRWLLDNGATIEDVRVRVPDLGDAFRELTGSTLTAGAHG